MYNEIYTITIVSVHLLERSDILYFLFHFSDLDNSHRIQSFSSPGAWVTACLFELKVYQAASLHCTQMPRHSNLRIDHRWHLHVGLAMLVWDIPPVVSSLTVFIYLLCTLAFCHHEYWTSWFFLNSINLVEVDLDFKEKYSFALNWSQSFSTLKQYPPINYLGLYSLTHINTL